jgi:hypothetical protein
MRAPSFAALVVLTLTACGGSGPLPLALEPDATLAPPKSKASPAPGPFNGTVEVTITSDRPANIYVSLDGNDPRFTATGRLVGPSPFTFTLDKTSKVQWFASADGKDEELRTGDWVRACGPKGTISGVVVVGSLAVGKEVGVRRNFELKRLGSIPSPGPIPFEFKDLASGTHRLQAQGDRDGDGQLFPVVDLSSDVQSVVLNLEDPFKACGENLELFLGASQKGLGTIKGTITLPTPAANMNLQISAVDAAGFGMGADMAALLRQLQAGDRVFTNATDTDYPYAITDLQPGRYVPVPALMGFGAGGLAVNFIANPLQPVTVVADTEATANFAFGPVTLSGNAAWTPATAPTGLPLGFVAARSVSITQGMQVLLMPAVFIQDGTTGAWNAGFGGQALRSNASFSLRVFPPDPMNQPLVQALTWAINPFAPEPAHATVSTGTADVTVAVTVP